MPTLPELTAAAEGAIASWNALRQLVEGRFIPRDDTPDYGVDGSLEVVTRDADAHRAYMTNARVVFQLKHAANARKNRDGSISCRVETKNLLYLERCAVPGIYLLYDFARRRMLMRWRDEVLRDLSRNDADWATRQTVRIRFKRVVDETALDEIAALATAWSGQARILREGPGLTRVFAAERLPEALVPAYPFEGRSTELDTLVSAMEAITVVALTGPPESGRTQLVAHALRDLNARARIEVRLQRPPALLYLDLGARLGPRSVVRNLLYAVDAQKAGDVGEINWDDEDVADRHWAEVLTETFPRMVQGTAPIAILDGFEHVSDNEAAVEDINSLLANRLFEQGTAVVVGRGLPVPNAQDRRALAGPIEVGPLPTCAARDVLDALVRVPHAAARAVEELEGLPELFFPGILVRAAHAYRRRLLLDAGDAPTSLAETVLEAGETFARQILAPLGCDEVTVEGRVAPLGSLLAMAIVEGLPFGPGHLSNASLAAPPFDILTSEGWLEVTGRDQFRLTRVGAVLLRRLAAGQLLNGPADEAELLTAGVLRLVAATEGEADDSAAATQASAIEEAVAWGRRELGSDHPLSRRMLDALILRIPDDIVLPVSLEEASEIHDAQRGLRDVAASLSDAILAARFEHSEPVVAGIVAVAIDALGERVPSAMTLRALDVALFIASSRTGTRAAQLLEVRERVATKLMALDPSDDLSYAQAKWATSWVLNTAGLLVGAARTDDARTALDAAERLHRRLPPHPAAAYARFDWHWLRSRWATLMARVQARQDDRVAQLREAVHHASEGVAAVGPTARAIRFYLRAMRRLLDELSSDEERQDAVREALAYGDSAFAAASMPLLVRTDLAAFVLHAARITIDPEIKLATTRRAAELAASGRDQAIAAARLGDQHPLLTLARIQYRLAKCHSQALDLRRAYEAALEARQLTDTVLGIEPSARAWFLALRIDDDWQRITTGASERADGIDETLRERLAACERWLETAQNSSEKADLAIWCLRRRWRDEGSIERLAAKAFREQWAEADARQQSTLLSRLHGKRRASLRAIEQRYGRSVESAIAEARNLAQYERSRAIRTRAHVCSLDGALAILTEAREYLGDDPRLLDAEAGLFRYAWDYPRAIEGYRRVLAVTPQPDHRRQVAVRLIDALLITTIDNAGLHQPHTPQPGRAIDEAQVLLDDLVGFGRVADAVALQRERVALERGDQVDWAQIGNVYGHVVGDVESYPATISRNIESLKNAEDAPPETTFAGIVARRYTSSRHLRRLGHLYLRKSEVLSDDAAADARRAYACFDAARIVEEAFTGRIHSPTEYLRARAILTSASAARSANPFPADTRGKVSLLHLAETRFQAAADRSVNMFYAEARRRQGEAARLRRDLGDV